MTPAARVAWGGAGGANAGAGAKGGAGGVATATASATTTSFAGAAATVTITSNFQAQAFPGPWRIKKLEWTATDEAGFGEFIRAIAQSDCTTTISCG